MATGEITERIGERFTITWTVHEAYAEVKAYDAPPPEPADDEPLIDATIKWDGCANWGVSTRGLAVHTCGAEDVQALAGLLMYLHKRAGELIPMAESPWR